MANRIVIVGGGSSGWMTAAYLQRALGRIESITVVESADVGTIGVGEATFSTVKLFFDFLGLQEHEWMPSCNAAYKLAIKFANWRSDGGHFYHPFQRYEVVDGFNLGEWWLRVKQGAEPFDYACFVTPALCDHKRSPRYLDGRVFDGRVRSYFTDGHIARRNVLVDHRAQFPYAYHFDAALLARFLKGHSMQRGVRQVVDDVVDVRRAEDGSISHLETRENGRIEGDLFVDCTGFRGLLINQALGEPFVSFSDSLLCDSAVALRVPSDIEADGIEPYTTATAMEAGWIWKIPLYGRIGTGYVYARRFLSPDQAERDLRRHLGPAAASCPANHIRMRIGRCRNSWVKNCVAIGLASGFVEPLESTGIFFIQHGIEELVNHFPQGVPDEETIKSYNRVVAECIDGVRDFLVIHYRASDRTDTEFWRATKQSAVPPSLEDRLPLWRTRLPNAKSINASYHGFESYSYSVMLLGLTAHRPAVLPALNHLDAPNAVRAFRSIKRRAQRLVATLPSQVEYLTHVRRQAETSAAAGAAREALSAEALPRVEYG